jgi:hypothetical protein
MNIVINRGDTVELLPEEAWKKIQEVLFNQKADAPGREELLETYCMMLFQAAHRAQAHNKQLRKTVTNQKKLFKSWLPVVRKCRQGVI